MDGWMDGIEKCSENFLNLGSKLIYDKEFFSMKPVWEKFFPSEIVFLSFPICSSRIPAPGF